MGLRRIVRLGVVCVMGLPVASAVSQIPEDFEDGPVAVSRPSSAGRIVRHFDFEERGFNAFEVPLYWIRAQNDPQVRERPGFPITNLGRLDYASAASSGFGTVRLDTRGGSTSLRLEPGVVPVFPSVQYAIGAMIRTEGLMHARPRVVARLLDEAGNPIAGAEAALLLDRTDDPEAGFVPTLLKLPPAPSDAVSVQIDLDLVQPAHQGVARDDGFELWEEDYSGTVWFDDVVIVQLPTATLEAASESGIFVQSEAPELLATIRDLSGDPINIELEVFDLDGIVVDQRIEQFGMGSREIRWQPDLPGLGWYDARLSVSIGDTPMLHLDRKFVWLPDPVGALLDAPRRDSFVPDPGLGVELADRRRLGLVMPGLEGRAEYDIGSRIIESSGAKAFFASIVLPVLVGQAATELEATSDDAELARFVTDLRSRLGAQATIVLEAQDSTQDTLRSRGDRSLSALDDDELWNSVLVAVVDRLAEALDRWHLGPLGADVLAATPQASAEFDAIARRLGRLSPDSRIGMPWSGVFDPARAALPGSSHHWMVTVEAPSYATGAWVGETVDRLSGMLQSGDITESVIVLHPLDEARFGRRAVVARLADQILAFWDSLPQAAAPTGPEVPEAALRLALADSWGWHEESGATDIDPAFAAWRGMSDRLAGMRRIYTFESLDGIIASIYEPIVPRVGADGGLLVLRPKPGRTPSEYEQFLGESPVRVYDVFGNQRVIAATETVEPYATTPRLTHQVPVDDLPVFVEGVDTNLLMFISSVRLEPELLPAIDIEHPAALVMRNPWPGVTSVRSRVVYPGGFGGQPVSERAWEISPRLSDLLIEAGEEQRTPINIRFRRSEPAGRKHLGLDLYIRGENATRRVHVDVPFRIGLDYLDITATARQTGDGVLVMVELRNVGDRLVTLEATAIAPGVGRRRAVVPQLAPGSTARRELLLRGLDTGAVQSIILAVEDIDVGARLNYQVDLP